MQSGLSDEDIANVATYVISTAAAGWDSPASLVSVSAGAEDVLPASRAPTMRAVATAPVLAGDKDAGAIVFSGNCKACHAGGQNIIQREKTLQQAALEEYLDGGANEAAVRKQVTNGKNAMPAFGGSM